jgi:hypothetical protein
MAGDVSEVPLQRGLRPDTRDGATVAPLPRRQASMETNLCRKGVWHVGPLQLALPLDSEDTLGLLRVAGPPLTMFDLDTFAWLTERWREGERDVRGRVSFTLYDLGHDLFGREPDGKERRLMRASLRRLYEANFELEGYRASDAVMGRLDHPTEEGLIRLLSSLRWSRQRSAEPHLAALGDFITDQLEADISPTLTGASCALSTGSPSGSGSTSSRRVSSARASARARSGYGLAHRCGGR